MRHLAKLDVCTRKAYFVVFRGTLTYTFVHAMHLSKTSCLFKVLIAIYFFKASFKQISTLNHIYTYSNTPSHPFLLILYIAMIGTS